MNEEDKLSIIMPAFNAAATIERAVASVLGQSYQNWELIIVEDGSSDETWDIVSRLASQEPRIRAFRQDENAGAAVARNRAIELATGRFIAFLDADDEWFPEKTARQLEFMQAQNAKFTCTAYERLHQSGKCRQIHVPLTASRRELLYNNTIGTLTAIFEKDAFPTVKMPLIRRRQDYALWLDILNETKFVYGLDEVLARYHQGHESLSSNKRKAARDQWRFYRRVLGFNVPKSMYYFLFYAVNSIKRHL